MSVNDRTLRLTPEGKQLVAQSVPCPGPGCLTLIPPEAYLCQFCTRTVLLQERAA